MKLTSEPPPLLSHPAPAAQLASERLEQVKALRAYADVDTTAPDPAPRCPKLSPEGSPVTSRQ